MQNKRQHGFTLIEIIFVIAVLGIVGVTTARIMNESAVSYEFIFKRNVLSKESRLFQDRFFQDIEGLTTLTQATNQAISWEAADGMEYSYSFTSGIVSITSTSGTYTLISHVDDTRSEFNDYDDELNGLNPLTQNARDNVYIVEVLLYLVNGDQTNFSRRQIYLENRMWY